MGVPLLRALLAVVVAIAFAGVVNAGEITAELTFTNVTIKWNAEYDTQSILFSISLGVSPPAVLLLGFSDFGDMNNTDCIIYYQGGQSGPAFLDASIDRKFRIDKDMQQDVEPVRFREKHVLFRRKMVTCDPKDYAFQTGTTQMIIAASWSRHGLRDMHDTRWYIDRKFGKVLETEGNREQKTEKRMESDTKSFYIIADRKNTIPAEETTYHCLIHAMPFETLNYKHHIIKMEPYITPGNEHLVHHMEVFQCQEEVKEWSGSCNDKMKPSKARTCSHVIAAWAMGEGPIVYPPEAGLPIGGKGKRRTYVMVEIHYNNPEKHAGVHDESGFKFYVTPSLRKYDAGIMELGLIYSDANSIPPGQKSWAMTGYCPMECTQYMPSEGINIFGSQLHAHLTGRKLWTSHYRNGVKIGEVNRDEHYSPHWQHVQDVRPYVNVKPGDVLATTCVYDTRKRSNMTFGGYSITDEMCVNYVYYYPATEIEVCKSAISNSTLRSYFYGRHRVFDDKIAISDMYNKVRNWTPEYTEELHALLSIGNINTHCLQKNGSAFPFTKKNDYENWGYMEKPKLFAGPFVKTRDRLECPAMNDMTNFD